MASSAPVNGASTAPPQKIRIKKNTTNPFGVARQPGGARPTPIANGRPTPAARPSPTPPALKPGQYSGFSDPKVGKYTDYKLVVTKKDLMDGLRHHILHLAGDKKTVDIRDQSQFARPAHLHRRDPMADSAGLLKDEQAEVRDGLTVNEREEQSKKNELRKQEREANLAQIAPTQSTRKGIKQTLKTKAVYHKEYTEEEKRRIQTNYEEKLPWHLEDFDGKHCFVGENQAPSAHRHVAFAYERPDAGTPKFRLVPVEKVYEFRPKRRVVQAQTLEEIEAAMSKKRATMPEWLERVEQKSALKRKEQQTRGTGTMYTGAVNNNKFAGRTGEGADLDFDDDELFADDEEGDIFKLEDEDEDLAKKKIKEDQLKANYFEVKEEREFDEEEEAEQREEQARKENFRKIRRALEKHEHDYNHASDSEYSDSVSHTFPPFTIPSYPCTTNMNALLTVRLRRRTRPHRSRTSEKPRRPRPTDTLPNRSKRRHTSTRRHNYQTVLLHKQHSLRCHNPLCHEPHQIRPRPNTNRQRNLRDAPLPLQPETPRQPHALRSRKRHRHIHT